MKKAFVTILSFVLVLGALGCSQTTETSSNYQSAHEETVIESSKEIDRSTAEDIAIDAALQRTYQYLTTIGSYHIKYNYNFDATKYDVGNVDIKTIGSEFECQVYGKLYFYDNYGDLVDIATFECKVEIDSNGETTSYNPLITIK